MSDARTASARPYKLSVSQNTTSTVDATKARLLTRYAAIVFNSLKKSCKIQAVAADASL